MNFLKSLITKNFKNILAGDSAVVLTGGVDNMSQSPHIVRNIRFGVPLGGAPVLEDSLWAGLTDSYCKMPMAITAENLADKYKISRDEVETYALQSQQRWKAGKFTLTKLKNLMIILLKISANDSGYFKEELAPVTIKFKGKEVEVSVDEHPKPAATKEGLAKLPSIFKKGGVVTAGTASVRILAAIRIN